MENVQGEMGADADTRAQDAPITSTRTIPLTGYEYLNSEPSLLVAAAIRSRRSGCRQEIAGQKKESDVGDGGMAYGMDKGEQMKCLDAKGPVSVEKQCTKRPRLSPLPQPSLRNYLIVNLPRLWIT